MITSTFKPMTIFEYRDQLRAARDHLLFERAELHRLEKRYRLLAREHGWTGLWYDRYVETRDQYRAVCAEILAIYRFLDLTYKNSIDDYIAEHTPALVPAPVPAPVKIHPSFQSLIDKTIFPAECQ